MYEVPFDPVTLMEAAFVSVTVSVAVCPDAMLFELALIDTVGTAAEALAAKTDIATKGRKRVREGSIFTGACLNGSCIARLRSGGRGGSGWSASVRAGTKWTDTKPFDAGFL